MTTRAQQISRLYADLSRTFAALSAAVLEPGDEPTLSRAPASKEAPTGRVEAAARPRQKPLAVHTADAAPSPKLRRTILIALAQFGRPMSTAQIGLYSGKAHKGGAFVKALADLRRDERVDGPGSALAITQAGFAELGDWAQLPEGSALFEFWCSKLGPMEEAILRDLRPRRAGVSTAEIGDSTGKAHAGGAFVKAIARLRKMELIEGPGHSVALSPILRRALEPTIGVYSTSTGKSVKLDARKGHVTT